MSTREPTGFTPSRRALAAMLATTALAIAGCTHVLAHPGHDDTRPAASEFGLGPRASAAHLYVATLQPEQPMGLRQLHSVRFSLVDTQGSPVAGAKVSVGGGMPEHRHGLPTQPRVVEGAKPGEYQIEGLRFSMGGWWTLELAVDGPWGQDRVTFNLSL